MLREFQLVVSLILPKFAILIIPFASSSLAAAKLRVPEPALERALCLALGVDRENLTQSLVATQLRHLEANDKQIRNLTGLEAAQNLETLALRDNLIENLLPISDLPNLKNLECN